jgi:protoheme IX farnesyltransferase
MASVITLLAHYLRLYIQLGKLRLSLLVLFTAGIGYGLGVANINYLQLLCLMVGTLLIVMGANGLNQCMERHRDALMKRTRNRPLPSGKMSVHHAYAVTLTWSISGVLILYIGVNLLTATLALFSLCCYLFVYTPLKPYTPIAVLAGAIPGAIPPIMGWTAATNEFSVQAWILACILYLWQIPHFMALATMYQKDYAAGGYQLLPDNPEIGSATRSIIAVFSGALLAISLLAPAVGLGEYVYFVAALVLGISLLFLTLKLYHRYSLQNARRVFLASIVYLPLLMAILVIDQRFIRS